MSSLFMSATTYSPTHSRRTPPPDLDRAFRSAVHPRFFAGRRGWERSTAVATLQVIEIETTQIGRTMNESTMWTCPRRHRLRESRSHHQHPPGPAIAA
jgi:hypothetical protein